MTRSTASSRFDVWQRGYSIVEMAIVLVAFGILLSGAVWAFGQYIRKQQEDSEQTNMRILADSVVSYALNTRTPGMVIEYSHLLETAPFTSMPEESAVGRQYIPSGRPILPCPDVTGDGWEDRTGSSQTLTSKSGNLTSYRIFYRYRGDDTANIPNIDLSTVLGRCIDNKGWLPWHTLKTNPADVWGRRYMYWVDSRFTMVPFGFDASTRASNIFKHAVKLTVPRVAEPDPCAAAALGSAQSGPAYRYALTYDSDSEKLTGNVVLSDYNTTDSRKYYPLPGLVRSSSDNISAGEIVVENVHRARKDTRRTSAAGTRKIEVYEYCSLDSGHVADGIAYAILSHGFNGFGGLVYNTNTAPGYRDSKCIPFPFFGAAVPGDYKHSTFEASNAVLNTSCSIIENNLSNPNPEHEIRTSTNICDPTSQPYPCRNTSIGISLLTVALMRDEFYALTKQYTNAKDTYDDILVWATPKQLYAALTKAGLPVLRPPAVVVLP